MFYPFMTKWFFEIFVLEAEEFYGGFEHLKIFFIGYCGVLQNNPNSVSENLVNV